MQTYKSSQRYSQRHLKIPQKKEVETYQMIYYEQIIHLLNEPIYKESTIEQISRQNNELRSWIRSYTQELEQQQIEPYNLQEIKTQISENVEKIKQLQKDVSFLKEKIINSPQTEQLLKLDDLIITYKSQIKQLRQNPKQLPQGENIDSIINNQTQQQFLFQKLQNLKQNIKHRQEVQESVTAKFISLKREIKSNEGKDRTLEFQRIKLKEQYILNSRKQLNELYEEMLTDHKLQLDEIDAVLKEWDDYKKQIRSEILQYRNHSTYNPSRRPRKLSQKVNKSVSFVESKSPKSFQKASLTENITVSELFVKNAITSFSHLKKSRMTEEMFNDMNPPFSKPVQKLSREELDDYKLAQKQIAEYLDSLYEAQYHQLKEEQATINCKMYLYELYRKILK